MIHIKRSTDKKFYVTVVGDNGEVISTSETLNSSRSAWKNIKSQCKCFNISHVIVASGNFKYWYDAGYNKKQKTT